MKIRLGMIIAGVFGLGVLAALAWYLASPLFINRIVEEDFPTQNPTAELAPMSAEKQPEMTEEARVEANPDKVAVEQPVLVSQGQFKDADSFHKGSGQATLYQLADGSYVLRFEDFSATNGPDLHVILSGHPAPTSSDEVMQGYLDLGSLKGNIGSQNYPLPAGSDVSQFKSVIIYCQPFQVVFATAALN